ncbi:MAG TPA: spermidine/putrescine ABC transporter substrate-binding protein [Opitutales bacterium]|nr:spermidine/putrescine ABC transporter substrate-binding protein [Opitutales bacterium]
MKTTRILTLFAAAATCALAFLSTSCSKPKPELHIYNWSDYFDADTLRNFEEKYHCKVVYDVFESNESMYAKLKAGASGYDVVFPTSYQARLMHDEGMIDELDLSRIPNAHFVDPKFLRIVALDKELKYSLPYMTGTTGLAYNKDKVPNFEASWAIYDRADLKGRMTLLNDYREVLGAALKYLGHSLNTTDPAQVAAAGEIVKRWKGNIAKFASDEYKPGMASGEFYVAMGYSGDVMQVQTDCPTVEFALPKEGFSFWADDMVIMHDAPNKELAYAFVNYLTDPAVAAKNMEFNNYLAPNTGAYELVPQEMRDDPMVFVPEEQMLRGEQIVPLGKDDQIYMDVWDKIKSQE